MGHPGNWSERKIAQVRAANAREAWDLLAQAVYLDESGFAFLSAKTPCDCFRSWPSLAVIAHCYGCRRAWNLPKTEIMDSRFSHRPWSEVARKMRCKECAHPVVRLVFTGELSKPLGSIVAKVPPSPEEARAIIEKEMAARRTVPVDTRPFKREPGVR